MLSHSTISIPGRTAVALVNVKSGGRRAADYVHDRLSEDLGQDNVLVLFSGDDPSRFVTDAEAFLRSHDPDVVVVCGGDGTMSFAMDVIKKLHDEHHLGKTKGVVAPFPLGTGNDLSCTLGYGGGFARWFVLGLYRYRRLMRVIASSKVVQVDRWHLQIAKQALRADLRDDGATRPPVLSSSASDVVLTTKVMNNYFSVGFDAAVAKSLNDHRKRKPHLFLTRPIVKLWYAFFAANALLSESTLQGKVTVFVDGKALMYPREAKAIVVSNMLTYAGGSILWAPNSKAERSIYQRPSLSDGKLEVCALNGVWHLALIRLGLCYATKLGQGEHVRILSSSSNHHQYDGEPLDIDPQAAPGDVLSFELSYFANADVLQAHLPRRHVFSIMLIMLTVLTALLGALYKTWQHLLPSGQ